MTPISIGRLPRSYDARPLHLDGLTPVRGHPLLEPVAAVLEPGTLLGIVGPNGAGKSSLLAAIAGTGVARQGVARYGTADIARLPARRRSATISLMTQDSTAPTELRAIDVVGIGVHAGRHRGNPERRARQALAALDIEHLAGRVGSTLSGGQRQLVQVARVLAQEAPIMLLDEPTSALDLGHQLTVMHALHERAASGGIVVVTMHDLTQALRWSTQVALVAGGVVELGVPAQILTPDVVRRAYGVEAEVFESPSGSPTISLVRPRGLSPIFPSREAASAPLSIPTDRSPL